jgi:hypothetical protein
MLFRGVTSRTKATARRKTMATSDLLSSSTIYLDTFNVLITVCSYLEGRTTYLANDGFLRDTAERHGDRIPIETIRKAVHLIHLFMVEQQISKMVYVVDTPVNQSEDLIELLNEYVSFNDQNVIIMKEESADKILESVETSFIATSDSTIIDRSQTSVVDIPRLSIEYHFSPEFLDLATLIP